jgi:hypothetical protein
MIFWSGKIFHVIAWKTFRDRKSFRKSSDVLVVFEARVAAVAALAAIVSPPAWRKVGAPVTVPRRVCSWSTVSLAAVACGCRR